MPDLENFNSKDKDPKRTELARPILPAKGDKADVDAAALAFNPEIDPRFPDAKILLAGFGEAAQDADVFVKDDKGGIKQVSYPDGSYSRVDYDAYGTPKAVSRYDKNGKELDTIKTDNTATSSVQLKVNDDGTIEKSNLRVTSTKGDDIFDKQGKVIGIKKSYRTEFLSADIWKPDGTHTIRRVDRGQTVEDALRQDGRTVRMTLDGNVIAEFDKNGAKAKHPEKMIWKQEVLSAAEKKITDKAALIQFKKDIDGIDARFKKDDLAEIQAAKTFQQIYRALTTKSQVGVSDENMIILARQNAYEQAHPKTIDQGIWDTCNSEGPRVKMSYTDSSVVAKVALDAAITGKYRDTRGTLVDVTKSVQPANKDELEVPVKPGDRSYTGQLFDVVAHNLELSDFNKAMGTNLEYVQGPVKGSDNGARIVDNNFKPPKEVYSLNEEQPIHTSTTIFDDKGIKQLDLNLQPRMTKPMSGIDLTPLNSLDIMERLTRRSMEGQVIGHFDNVGRVDNWVWDKVGVANNIKRDWRIPFFKTEADLEEIFLDARVTGKFPILLQTDTGGGILAKQVEAASGKPLGGEGGNFGGGHVLCITDYDPVTKTCTVDNTWGAKHDIKKATLGDILEMSRKPERLRQAQADLEVDIRDAYKQWCNANRAERKFNRDFPSPDVGRKLLEDLRRKRGHLSP